MSDHVLQGTVAENNEGLGRVEEGRALLVAGRLLEARASFEQVAVSDESEPHAHLFQAWSELALETSAKQKVAVQVRLSTLVGKALEAYPDCTVANYFSAELASLRRRFDEAELHFRKAKTRDLSKLECACHQQRAPRPDAPMVRRTEPRTNDRGLTKLTPGGFNLASLDLLAPLDLRAPAGAQSRNDTFASSPVIIRQPPRRITSLIREAITPQIGQAAAQGPMQEQLHAAEPSAKAEADSMGGLSRATPVSSGEMDSLCELLASEDAPASVRGAMKLSNVGPTQMEPAQVEATKAIAPALKGVGTLEVEGSAALPGSHAGAPNAASGMLSFPSRKRVVRLLSGLGASVALLMATIVVPRFTEPSSSHATSFGAPARAEPTTIPVTSPRVPVAAPALVAAPSVVASPETQHAEVAPASPSVAKNISKTSRLVVAKVKGRRVFVDGRLVGEAPLSIELACGAHEVRIGSKGAKDLLEFPCGETVER